MRASVGKKTLRLAQFAMLLAIEAVVCFTPLGSLPAVGPLVATLGMVPVILTAIVMGMGAGSAMGAFAGLFSLIVWTFMPPPLSAPMAFVFTPAYPPGNFWSLVICFVPRILTGTVSAAFLRLFTRLKWKSFPSYAAAGALGSLTNTVLVLGGIYLFFGSPYAAAAGQTYGALPAIVGLTILTNGLPEAFIGACAAYFIGYPLRKHVRHNFE